MFYIEKITSKPLALLMTLVTIGVITVLDYLSGAEMSFSIFYLIPISILSISKTSSKRMIILVSVVAAICWFLVDSNSKDYSNFFFPVWNAFVRLTIFITIGLLIQSFRYKNEALNKTNETLKYLNDEKNKFIGIAAHDIRNPISGIYSFSDLLLSDKNSKMNEEELEIVTMMKSLSENILDLIKYLLDVSKIESGKIDLKFVNQDYIAFLKKQIHINQLLANKKQIKIDLHTSDLQIMADFDDHYMTEVINNLLSNAIKYSERNGTITIKVALKNDLILTEIIDQGHGIPLDEQDKLFKYFHKTSTKPTEGETSTGLGLAIVKKLVDSFGGTIGVKSKIKEGSNFYYSFPTKQN